MIHIRASRALAAGAVVVTLATAGHAATLKKPASITAIHSDTHSGVGRQVIDTNGKTDYQVDQNGDHVVVRLDGDLPLGTPPALPRNVIAIAADGQTLDLVLSPSPHFSY